MSAWSDWRVGALTDAEYRQAMAYEARRDAYNEERLLDNALFDDLDVEEWDDSDNAD